MFSFALHLANPPILVAMEIIRFLSGLCYSFPSFPSVRHLHAYLAWMALSINVQDYRC
jgi:hypothetical protein